MRFERALPSSANCLTRTGRLEQALACLLPRRAPADTRPTRSGSEPWSPVLEPRPHPRRAGSLSTRPMHSSAACATTSPSPLRRRRAPSWPRSSAASAWSKAASRAPSCRRPARPGRFIDLGLTVPARRCYTLCATSLALAGAAAKADETLVELDALGLPADLSYEVEVLQARAWVWAAGGDMASGTPEPRGGGRARRRNRRPARRDRPPSTGWPGWDGPARSSTSSASWPSGWTAS